MSDIYERQTRRPPWQDCLGGPALIWPKGHGPGAPTAVYPDGTIIQHSGYRWNHQYDDPLDDLFRMLDNYPLRRELAGSLFGLIDPGPDQKPGELRLWGNFDTYSYAFDVRSSNEEVVDALLAAVGRNMMRADFLSQPCPHAADVEEAYSHRDEAEKRYSAARGLLRQARDKAKTIAVHLRSTDDEITARMVEEIGSLPDV